jgi:hypothetical protein
MRRCIGLPPTLFVFASSRSVLRALLNTSVATITMSLSRSDLESPQSLNARPCEPVLVHSISWRLEAGWRMTSGASVDKESGRRLFPMDKIASFICKANSHHVYPNPHLQLSSTGISASLEGVAEAVRRSSVPESRAHTKGMGTCILDCVCRQVLVGHMRFLHEQSRLLHLPGEYLILS